MTTTLPLYQFDESYLRKYTPSRLATLSVIIAVIALIVALYFAYIAIVHDEWALLIFTFFAGILGVNILSNYFKKKKVEKRLNYVLNTPMPSQLWHNEAFRNTPITHEDKQLIEAGLRDFFILHILFPTRPIAMPSKMVDKLWHAFILDTQSYQSYCKQAFGSVFHHVPDYEFSDRGKNIRLFTWQSACRLQGIRPARPDTLPRLFGVDPLLVNGVVVGTGLWLAYQQEMGMLYQQWHASTFNSSSSNPSSDNNYSQDYDDSCDVGVDSSGDCSCGGSGDSGSCGGGSDSGSSCGGGCGGGGGD